MKACTTKARTMKHIATLLALALVLTAVPAFAQDGGTNTVAFNEISFSFDDTLAKNVNIAQVASDPMDLDTPAGPEPTHTEIMLSNNHPITANYRNEVGNVRIYQVSDLEGFDDYAAELANLSSLLTNRPDLSTYLVEEASGAMNLPFLPVIPATQVLRARAHYVDLNNLSGISYITIYRHDASPLVNNEFIYTFQGLNADGTRYISAIFPLVTNLFTDTLPSDFDYEAWYATYDSYMAESIAQLNNAAPDAISPPLTLIDAMIESITISAS